MQLTRRATITTLLAMFALLLAAPAHSFAGSIVANATADTFVDSAQPATSMGSADLVNIDYDSAASQRIALVKFTVPTLPAGHQVANVKLRFYVTNPGGATTAVYSTSNTWTESTTWNTRPALGTKRSADSGAVANGWFTYDLGTAVTAGGTYGFAIASTSSDGVQFVSRAYTPAQLVVTTRSTTTINTNADTYVDSKKASTSMGSSDTVHVDYDSSSNQRFALLKFTVPTLPAGDYVSDVSLRINVFDGGGASTAVYSTSTTWSETTTWNSRPAIGTKRSASSGAVPTGWFTYGLGIPLTTAGTYGFAIQGTSSDGIQFRSRNVSPAQLLVTTTGTVPNPPAATLPPAPAPPPPPPSSTRPGPTNTGWQGVPSTLARHDGNIKITVDGTVLEGKDIYGNITVQANNVTIRRSIVRGDRVTGSFEGIITALGGHTGLVIEDVTILPQLNDRFQDGIRINQATIRRVNISGTIDGVGVQTTTSGQHTRIENSWIHHLVAQADPTQPDGVTHNDALQMHGGAWDITVTGSDLTGTSSGAAIMMSAGPTVSGRLSAVNSWFGGGGCSINISDRTGNRAYQGTVLTGNTFARGTTGTLDCAVRVNSATKAVWTYSNNLFHDGTAARIYETAGFS